MRWFLSYQADPRACKLADRHYSRQHPGSGLCMPPGRMLVLLSDDAKAVWGTSWPKPELVPWRVDSWLCSLFRNESPYLSSELILEAIAATRWKYGTPPKGGMITYVDAGKVKSANPGYCYKQAGFKHVGYTQGGLHILQLLPDAMSPASMPNGATFNLFEETA